MKNISIDVAIIGAGTAGRNAQREVEKAGRSWLLIEGGVYGTTCARVGCMPSKLLIAAAERAHQVREADEFGIRPEHVTVDGRAVMQRVRALRDDFVNSVVEGTQDLPADRRPRGHARLTGPNSLRVGRDLEVRAQAIVVVTGSTPIIPEPLTAVADQLLTSDNLFEMENFPRNLAVVGAGFVGLELGQALSRLGVQVTLFNRSDELRVIEDSKIRKIATDILRGEVELSFATEITGVKQNQHGFELSWSSRHDQKTHRQTFEKILVAAGRQPNIADLGLETIGQPLDNRGLPAWNPETTQCGDAPVFLAGDVTGKLLQLHEAADEGRIAGRNSAAYPEVAAYRRRTRHSIVFTDPQIAQVGQTLKELDPDAIEIADASFDSQGRARVMHVNRGLLRIYAARESCKLLGAELFAPRAEHLSHLLALAIQQDMTVTEMLRLPFYHPVLEESLQGALRQLARKFTRAKNSPCPREDELQKQKKLGFTH